MNPQLNIRRTLSLSALVLAATLLGALPVAAAQCVLNQQQWLSNGAVPFGGTTRLGQVFTPSANGPVCRVEVRIRRQTTAGAGLIKLSVLTMTDGLLDSAVLPAPPVGESTQTFDLGCDGGGLKRIASYRLRVESPGSPMGTYAWLSHDANLYGPGQAQRRVGNGAWGPVGAGNLDYRFKVYLCQ